MMHTAPFCFMLIFVSLPNTVDGRKVTRRASDVDASFSGTDDTIVGTSRPCPDTMYRCNDRRCIPLSWLCDTDRDCPGGEDEIEEQCILEPPNCSDDEFQCTDGTEGHLRDYNPLTDRNSRPKCIPKRWKCDGEFDCADRSDEQGCPGYDQSKPSPPSPPHSVYVVWNHGISLNVTWSFSGLTVDGHIVTKPSYKVQYGPVQPADRTPIARTELMLTENMWAVLEDLTEDMSYDIYVSAVNTGSGLESVASEMLEVYMTPDRPKQYPYDKYDCGDGLFIDFWRVCDGKTDCPNAVDEYENNCNTNQASFFVSPLLFAAILGCSILAAILLAAVLLARKQNFFCRSPLNVKAPSPQPIDATNLFCSDTYAIKKY